MPVALLAAPKKLLIVCRRAPYGSSLPRAALDIALAAAALGQNPQLLFMDDGVFQLLPAQQTADIAAKSLHSTLQSLPLYDIEAFYVDRQSLQQRGLSEDLLAGELRLLNGAQIRQLFDRHQHILSF